MIYNVLIVDDVAVNRRLMRSVLSSLEDVNFSEAEDGFKALEVVQNQEIHLVILDLMMPGKDGFEVLDEMKTQTDLCDIPVVVYSAIDGIDSISRALDLGAYDYFTKPLTPQQMKVVLPMKVRNALKSYNQKKQLEAIHEKMQLELMLANLFQQSLMAEHQDFSALEMYGRYLPSNEIGGDCYVCYRSSNGDIWFMIADISGHGVTAAMMSSMVKVEFTNQVKICNKPSEVLQNMNRTFYPLTEGNYYFTAFVGLIRSSEFVWSNGGHPYPLYYDKNQEKVSILQSNGFAVGMLESAIYEDITQSAHSGDILFLYTDGLLEDKQIALGGIVYEDLCRYFLSYKDLTEEKPEEFFNVLLNLFGNVENKAVRDDVALMLLKIK